MRWLFFLLLASNVAFFSWMATLGGPSPERGAEPGITGGSSQVPRLRLLSEVQSKPAATPMVGPPAAVETGPSQPAPGTAVSQAIEPPRPPQAPEPPALAGAVQAPVGPGPAPPEQPTTPIAGATPSEAEGAAPPPGAPPAGAQRDAVRGEPEPAPPPAVAQPSPVVPAAEAIPPEAKAARACYWIGPWPGRTEADSVAARLREAGATVVTESGFTEEVIGYWLLQPPLDSIEAATARMRELRQLGIDNFVITEPPLANAISLGVFKQESAAQRGRAEFESRGIEAEVQPRTRRREAYWLYAEWPGVSPAAALPGGSELTDLTPLTQAEPCR